MTTSFQSSEEAFDALCALGEKASVDTAPAQLLAQDQALRAAENAAGQDVFLPAATLRDAFSLTGCESVLLAWCAFCLQTGHSLPDAAARRAHFAAFGENASKASPLFFTGLHPYAVDFLMGQPPRLSPGMQLEFCSRQPLFHGEKELNALESFAKNLTGSDGLLPAAIVLRGEAGSGRHFIFGQLAARLGCTLLRIDGSLFVSSEDVLMAVRIYSALVLAEENTQSRAAVQGLFEQLPLTLYLAAPGEAVKTGAKSVLVREVPALRAAERRVAAQALLGASGPEWEPLLSLYRPGVGQLCAAAVRLRAETVCGETISAPDAAGRILREHNGAALAGLANRLEGSVRLSDLVLPPIAMRQLCDLCAYARVGDTVFTQWGFGEKMPGGRGLSALFYGASGTGKTMAARAVAGELGMELYRVDLARILSKYIGETQKNISRVFEAAQKCDCVLFFDEADALFARRSEAGDAQDKYSNAEIACLLQCTEQYDGIILMATNLLQNFDEAFRRRIRFMVHFPLPEEAQRLKLWEKALPQAAPAAPLDFSLLASNLELSGAGIRSAVLDAARSAAAFGGQITMQRVISAARSEYQKLGKPFPSRLELMYPSERSAD